MLSTKTILSPGPIRCVLKVESCVVADYLAVKLDSMLLVHPFQFGILYDSILLLQKMWYLKQPRLPTKEQGKTGKSSQNNGRPQNVWSPKVNAPLKGEELGRHKMQKARVSTLHPFQFLYVPDHSCWLGALWSLIRVHRGGGEAFLFHCRCY